MKTEIARPFFFLHIRKTAGVSFRGLLANRFPSDRILFQAHSVSGPNAPGDALFATGHVGFDYAQRFGIWPTIFTVLREPISRCLSAYHFFQSHEESHFRTLATELTAAEYESRRRFSDCARRLGMRRFLVEQEPLARAGLSNIQTRHLAGASCAGLADDDPRLMETALRHLDQIDLTGLVERLDDTLRLLGHLMNWGRLGPLQHLNITVRSNDASDADPGCIEILRSWNQLDLRLYQEASRLFEAKLRTLNERSQEEVSPDGAWLADGGVFTPDQPLCGYGWYERERHQGRWLCWNSSPVATLNLCLSASRPSKFRCLLSHVVREAALDQLGITLNSVPLSLQKREHQGGILVESDIPAQASATNPHLSRLTFYCPDMPRPCDIDPDSTDTRNLGVAIGWIRFD
jgi:hypothetical protein